jgi:hypothetical protein
MVSVNATHVENRSSRLEVVQQSIEDGITYKNIEGQDLGFEFVCISFDDGLLMFFKLSYDLQISYAFVLLFLQRKIVRSFNVLVDPFTVV